MASRYHFEVARPAWALALGLAGLLLLALPAAASSLQAGNATAKPSPTQAAPQRAPDTVASTPSTLPPAEQSAQPAKVEFNRGKVTIQADNSSLVAILREVSRQTGMTISGLNQDRRVYGEYGPGSVAAVLAQLLDGSGYNYVILNRGAGNSPAKLLLTSAGSASSSAQPAPTVATSSAPPTASAPAAQSAPGHPKTPQQIFEELRRMHPRH